MDGRASFIGWVRGGPGGVRRGALGGPGRVPAGNVGGCGITCCQARCGGTLPSCCHAIMLSCCCQSSCLMVACGGDLSYTDTCTVAQTVAQNDALHECCPLCGRVHY